MLKRGSKDTLKFEVAINMILKTTVIFTKSAEKYKSPKAVGFSCCATLKINIYPIRCIRSRIS